MEDKNKYRARVLFNMVVLLMVGYLIYSDISSADQNNTFRVYPTIKKTEQKIDSATTVIHHHETQVINEKKIIAAISKDIDELREELAEFKTQKDTFQIVQIQDTLIDYLTAENKHLYNVVDHQDSIITAQRFVINQKDTIISTLIYQYDQDTKHLKKQRNIAVAVGLGEFLIISLKK